MSSIYYYKNPKEVKDFVVKIDDETFTIAEAFATLRETVKLPKTWKQTTIKQLKDNPKLILELVKTLRSVMLPESKFKMPYKRVDREQELISDLAENYHVNVEKANAKIKFGHWRDPNAKEFAQEFNYCVEAAIAPRTDIGSEHAGEIEIVGMLNGTVAPIGDGESYFTSHYEVYYWLDKHSERQMSSSVRQILQTCGFSRQIYDAKRRVPSVLYINLTTPCAEYLGGAGKAAIDLQPYAADIAEVVKNLAYKIQTYHNTGVGTPSWDFSSNSGEGRQKSAEEYLEDFLTDRNKAIMDNSSLIYQDRLTQSGVWYRIRPIMIDGGYEPRKTWGEVRKNITSMIDRKCKELFRKEREELGIYAKARGVMLYNGVNYPVDAKSFEALGEKGVFILVIEKEGIADFLKEIARDSGIALVHTGGKFTKDVKKLIDGATSPIALLTDYDYDGMKMAEETIRPTDRIGIDKDIVRWLQQNGYPEITIEKVEEDYTPRIMPKDKYLQKKRIELDSIVAAFPDSPGRGPEALWKYVEYKINKLQKTKGFDYSNVISKPDIPGPAIIRTLLEKVEEYVEDITNTDWEILQEQLVGIKKLDSIKTIEKEYEDALTEIVDEDEGLGDIVSKLEQFKEELDELMD